MEMNPNDTEESVWDFFCEAHTVGSLAPKTLGDAKLWTGCGFLGPQESATDTERVFKQHMYIFDHIWGY